ncbi:peroxiredoxin family protein [Muriicola sp. E247]|uniref:peroxiredoxin family protein n=1 Tax=Muriicola sp. E247 TaxID=3242730 RepID=UPI0035241231
MKLFNILLILTIGISSLSYSQQKQVSVSYSVTKEARVLDTDLIYNKTTGEKISEKEFRKLVKLNPRLNLERLYDARGNIIRYIYDPNNQNVPQRRYPYSVAPKGKPYPNFILNTTNEEQIELEKLKGKLVIVRFELFSSGLRFKQNEVEDLDQKINALDNQEEIESIIIFGVGKEEVEKGFSLANTNFKLVSDGEIFFDKYQIDRFPMTALIDKEGNLIDYFKYSEDIDFKNHF